MNFQGLLAMLGNSGGAQAAPTLYSAAATGGASGPGYVGNISPQQMQGLLAMSQGLSGGGGSESAAPAPMPAPPIYRPTPVPMPQVATPRWAGPQYGLLGRL